MKHRKLLAILAMLLLVATLMAACGTTGANPTETTAATTTAGTTTTGGGGGPSGPSADGNTLAHYLLKEGYKIVGRESVPTVIDEAIIEIKTPSSPLPAASRPSRTTTSAAVRRCRPVQRRSW